MKKLLTTLALAAVTAAGAGTAFAEVSLEGVGWQLGKVEKPARPAVWTDGATAAYNGKKMPLVRAVAKLKNRGPKAADGVLIRYVLSAKIAPEGATDAGTPAVGFAIDERRVPEVKPNSELAVPLTTSPKLDLYLAKLKRAGYRATSVRIEAMLEPRDGAAVRVWNSDLEVKP